MSLPAGAAPGATAVITHHVRSGREADYQQWLGEISPLGRTFPGYLDLQLISPIAGLTTTFTIIIRFDSTGHLRQWLESPQRLRLIEKVRPLLQADDAYTIRSGLDFWFAAAGTGAAAPVRWKQFLSTWSAIFPLVYVVPLLLAPVLRALGAPESRLLATLVASGLVVLLMTYVVMPRYARLLQGWLSR